MWINGELVLADHVARALSPDDDAVAVSLVKGKNRILVKVSQAAGEWAFSLRFLPTEADAKAAASVALNSLAAYPDQTAVPIGGSVRGTVMTKPAYCIAGEARVELLGSGGELLGT